MQALGLGETRKCLPYGDIGGIYYLDSRPCGVWTRLHSAKGASDDSDTGEGYKAKD